MSEETTSNMSEEKTELRAHVVAFAFPFGSHPTPLLQLVKRLASAAPDVRFSYFNTTVSNEKLFSRSSLYSYDNIKAYNVDDGAPEGHVFSGNPMEAIELFIKATPDNFKRRLENAVEETGMKATCLLTDAFLWFSVDMAEELGIPWLASWTAGPTPISLHLYTDVIHKKLEEIGNSTDRDQIALDFLPGMSTLCVTELPDEILNLDRPFSRLLYKMSHALPHATAVILNSFDNLEPTVETDLRSKLRKLLTIGPAPPPICSNYCTGWLSSYNRGNLAYICFGTMLTPPPSELIALASALEENNTPYLWSFPDVSKWGPIEEFIERTKEKGRVVRWVPQVAVLSHSKVRVFITHGGWNSVMEAIAGGIPMICRPFFGDQMVNRRRVEETWGIGVGVEGGVFTKEGTVRALRLVMEGEEGMRMKENICRVREIGAMAVGENGSSDLNFKSLVSLVTSESDVNESRREE